MAEEVDVTNTKSGCCKDSFKLPKSSSLPAITHLCQSKSKGRKAFYFLLFIISLSVCCHHVYNFMKLYFQYPVLTSIAVESNLHAEFPAVTVCNLNRVTKGNVDNVLNNIPYTISPGVPTGLSGGGAYEPTERQSIDALRDMQNGSSKNLYEQLSSFHNAFTNLDDFSRENYGYDLDSMVAACLFGSELCHKSNFTLFQSFQYGNCYTFNKRKDSDSTRLKSHLVGSDFGLVLILDTNHESYMDITPSVGLRVIIHDAGEDPDDPTHTGVTISPGFETHIAMTKSSIWRLPSPYRDHCFDYKGKTNESIFSSQMECIKNCQQEASFTRCSCIEPFFPTKKLGLRRCDLKNATESSCLNAVVEDFQKNGIPCECPIPCIINNFHTEIFSSAWPDHNLLNLNPNYELQDYATNNQNYNTSRLYNHFSGNFNYSGARFYNHSRLHRPPLYPTATRGPSRRNYTFSFPNSPRDSHNEIGIASWNPNLNFPYYTPISLNDSEIPSWNTGPSFYNPNGPFHPYNDTGIPSLNSRSNFSDFYDYDPYPPYNDSSDTAYDPNIDYDGDLYDPRTQKRTKLRIFFKNFDHTIYSQAPMLTESEIISHVGGLLSFWLGFSILTFYEYLEIAILFLKSLCTRGN